MTEILDDERDDPFKDLLEWIRENSVNYSRHPDSDTDWKLPDQLKEMEDMLNAEDLKQLKKDFKHHYTKKCLTTFLAHYNNNSELPIYNRHHTYYKHQYNRDYHHKYYKHQYNTLSNLIDQDDIFEPFKLCYFPKRTLNNIDLFTKSVYTEYLFARLRRVADPKSYQIIPYEYDRD